MKLANAFLCADCEEVGSSAKACEKCSSTAVYPLQRLLDRVYPLVVDAWAEKLIESVRK